MGTKLPSYPLDMYFYTCSNYEDMPVRRLKIIAMSKILSSYKKYREMKKDERTRLLKHIERSFYHKSLEVAEEYNVRKSWDEPQFEKIYHNATSEFLYNLDPESPVGSRYLGNAILEGKLDPKTLGKLTVKDMCPEKHQEEMLLIEERRSQKIKYRYSKFYKCRNCGKKTCITENLYNRSFDEGVNLQIKCVTCGHSRNG